MQATHSLFIERKKEVELFYQEIESFDQQFDDVRLYDKKQLFKILKSNFLLMLYNLVEACVVSGMREIYDCLEMEGCPYDTVNAKVRKLWSEHSAKKQFSASMAVSTYAQRLQEAVESALVSAPINLDVDQIKISGNLDARAIKSIYADHGIVCQFPVPGECLKRIKDSRNALAHGDESFGNCARDLTLEDLRAMKEEVLHFISAAIDGMSDYYSRRGFLSAE